MELKVASAMLEVEKLRFFLYFSQIIGVCAYGVPLLMDQIKFQR